MEKEHYLKDELYTRVQHDKMTFDFIQAGSLDGIWYWDLEHPEHMWMSPKFWEALGIDPESTHHLSSEWEAVIFPEDLALLRENFQRHLNDPKRSFDQIVRYRHKNGRTVWMRCRGIAIKDENGKPKRLLGAHNNVSDIMEIKQTLELQQEKIQLLNEQLKSQATHDFLTSLYNRRGVEEHLYQLLEYSKRENTPISFVMLDIDFFKRINDTYGHDTGDEVLKGVSNVLLYECRSSDIISRYGGEEFLIVMPNTAREAAMEATGRIRESIKKDTFADGVSLTVSCGVSTRVEIEEETRKMIDTMMGEADRALYFAKEHGRDRIDHFDAIDGKD